MASEDVGVRDWRDYGVVVRRAPMESSGMLVREAFPISVWVNERDNSYRQNFSIAHEVGHYVFPDAAQKDQQIEEICESFAAELLLPMRIVRTRMLDTGVLPAREIVSLAQAAQLNFMPVMLQAAQACWSEGFLAFLADRDGRVIGGAGTGIGPPFKGQRLQSLGRWFRRPLVEIQPSHSSGTAVLDFRFRAPAVAAEGDRSWRSGSIRGRAIWDSVSLRSGARIVSLNILEPREVHYSKRLRDRNT
jgi:hypothetical protein